MHSKPPNADFALLLWLFHFHAITVSSANTQRSMFLGVWDFPYSRLYDIVVVGTRRPPLSSKTFVLWIVSFSLSVGLKGLSKLRCGTFCRVCCVQARAENVLPPGFSWAAGHPNKCLHAVLSPSKCPRHHYASSFVPKQSCCSFSSVHHHFCHSICPFLFHIKISINVSVNKALKLTWSIMCLTC